MKNKRVAPVDYILIGLSVVCFAGAVALMTAGLLFAAVGIFCVFGCILLKLLQRQLARQELKVCEQPDYQELVKKLACNKRVTQVQLNLMETKLQETQRQLQRYIRLSEEKGAKAADTAAGKENVECGSR